MPVCYFLWVTRYGVGRRACVTAAVRELMLLTLGDEEQTGTKTREYGGWETGKYKKKKKKGDVGRRTGMETAVPL